MAAILNMDGSVVGLLFLSDMKYYYLLYVHVIRRFAEFGTVGLIRRYSAKVLGKMQLHWYGDSTGRSAPPKEPHEGAPPQHLQCLRYACQLHCIYAFKYRPRRDRATRL